MIDLNLQFFAEDGILGKKLYINITDASGNILSTMPEMLKWNVEEITEEQKKHPIGEEFEHRNLAQMGFKGSFEGENPNTAYDDIMDLKDEYQKRCGGTLKFMIHTKEIYKNGDIREYRYNNVTFEGFKKTADGGNKPTTATINWNASSRTKV